MKHHLIASLSWLIPICIGVFAMQRAFETDQSNLGFFAIAMLGTGLIMAFYHFAETYLVNFEEFEEYEDFD